MSIIQTLTLTTLLLFFVKVLKDASYFLWLFQVKEYRLDRMKSYLRENLKFNLSDFLTALGVFVLLGILFPAMASFIIVFSVLILGGIAPLYFLYSLFRLAIQIKKHSLKRPKPTLKIILVLISYFILYSGFIALITVETLKNITIIYTLDFFVLFSFYLLILNLLVPLFILLAILIVTPVSNFQKKRILNRARLKMTGMKKVKTIGITGSFGKTSTKEFLYSILSQKYKVVKTSGNNNTNMGVANTILRDVSDDFDYFICEMGAYRIGEIKEICSLARPFAGVLTGINEQHIDLFGSIENTKRAKFELIQSLPKDGFAVIDKEAEERQPKLGHNVQDVTLLSEDLANNVKVNPDSVEFEYKEVSFKINMLGKHYIKNLLAAIVVCEKLGMSLEEIQDAVSKIDIKSDYLMQKIEGPHDSIFIDDSYSANPTGVLAALEYLNEAYGQQKKILVFPGIIELGKKSEDIHKKIWQKTDEVCQFAYILQKENKGIKETYRKCQFVFETDFDKMKEEIEKRIDKNSVVLFESRGAGVVMKKLLKNKEK